MAWTRIAEARAIAPGRGAVVVAAGKTLAVFNCDGTFYAVDNPCRHRGGPLGEGQLSGAVVSCPWHGWRYDVRTGANVSNPAVAVGSYPVLVEGDTLYVDL